MDVYRNNILWNLITASSIKKIVFRIKFKHFNYDSIRDIFEEIKCYAELLLEYIIKVKGFSDYYKLIVPFIYSRYCTVSRLLNGVDSVFNRILSDKLSRSSKSWLLEILNKISEEGVYNVLKKSNIILNEFRRRIPLFVIKVEDYCKTRKSRGLIWQLRGFELADGNHDGSFGVSTPSLLWIILNLTRTVYLKFSTMYIRASLRDIVYEFIGIIPQGYATNVQRWRYALLSTYEREGFNGLLERGLLPEKLEHWYRFFAGLFDGDGFIKVKHRYSIDIGLSFGKNLKGLVVSSIVYYASNYLRLFDIGYFDKKSCKVYFRLSGRSLRFFKCVVGFLFHFDRRFKLERFLFSRLVVPG